MNEKKNTKIEKVSDEKLSKVPGGYSIIKTVDVDASGKKLVSHFNIVDLSKKNSYRK